MTITIYSVIFSFLWGSIFFLVLMCVRRYLLRHHAYYILIFCSLFAIFRFIFIFDININLYSNLFYQIGKGVTFLLKKFINNSVIQFNYENNWNILTQIFGLFHLFFYIWIIGIVSLIFKSLVQTIKFMKTYKEIPQSKNPTFLKILKCVKSDMNFRLDVRIIESEYVKVPFLCGFFHPTIYLNTCFHNENEIYSVIYHELTHFVKHDNWLKFFLYCINIFFWWNPMIRNISENIYDACEYRCDQIVTKNMSSIQKIDYASIINRMTGRNASTPIGVTLVTKLNSDCVYHRLNTFLYPCKIRPAIRVIITSATGLMIVLSLLSILLISQANDFFTPADASITSANSYLIQNEKGSYDLYCMDELIDTNLTDLTGLSGLPIK